MLVIPCGCLLHTLLQLHPGRKAQLILCPANIINAAACEEFDTTACQGGMLSSHARRQGEDVRSEVGKPERDAASWQFLVQGMSNGSGKLAAPIVPLRVWSLRRDW